MDRREGEGGREGKDEMDRREGEGGRESRQEGGRERKGRTRE